ncbi:MAG TPA: FAD-dependent oxidoreductase, partial [Bauldia sp.]|nr:FAD-dependent oxidoreductase [Bauldia sp.]
MSTEGSGSDFDVVVVGAGAAGIAAARRLVDAGLGTMLVEARDRVGGRAWTIAAPQGFPIDLGCGWLHSADRNVWREIAEARGFGIDRTPPPWSRPVLPKGAPTAEQKEFGEAIWKFRSTLDEFPEGVPDRSAASFLPADGKWNPLLDAVSTFYSGAELARISVRDLARYDDTGVNWRVREGYGALVAGYAAGLPVTLGCEVLHIDRRGSRLAVETTIGTLRARAVVVTLSSNIVAENETLFLPALPEKAAAAGNLPLGLADKLFLGLDGADEFHEESRAFGRMDRTATAAYHFRPFGRPEIEAYFGGALAAELEAGGPDAFWDFAVAELTAIFGSAFAARL